MLGVFPSESAGGDHESGQSLLTVCRTSTRLLGFWTAVLLPFVILGLLAGGIAQESPLLFSGLVAANVAGIVLGKNHRE